MVVDPTRGLRASAVPLRPAATRSSGSPTALPAVSSTARSARRAIRCPRSRSRGRVDALGASMGYPPSAGSAALREPRPRGSRVGSAWPSTRRTSARASAPRSSSPALPHLLRLRNPQRDTVLYPAVAYPSYEMGAVLAGCRAVPVPLDAEWHLDLDADRRRRRRARAAAVGERAREPDVVGGRLAHLARVADVGTRARHRRGERRVLRRVAPEPATILASGLDGVLAMHSLSKRSNLAGMRVGFYAGDPDLVVVSRRDPQARGADGAGADAGGGGRRAR